MKNRIHKKLSLKKITISTHEIYGGSDDTTIKSSAFDEPTETPRIEPGNPALISGNNETCI